jgi:hypothetical protein
MREPQPVTLEGVLRVLSKDRLVRLGRNFDVAVTREAQFAEHPGWHARQDVLQELEIDAGSWNRAIRELVESEEVVRTGEKRGPRYRWWEHAAPLLF